MVIIHVFILIEMTFWQFFYGFNHVWLSQNVVNEDIFMLEFKQRVIDTFLNEAISFFLKNRQNVISISIYMMTITLHSKIK
jgi:hypothetical protein